MCYTTYERSLMAKIVRKGYPINFVAEIFSAHRNTVSYWTKQDLRTVKNIPKFRDGKITIEVEIMILYLRITFGWGTARIQQGLMKIPQFMLTEMEVYVQNFYLSRTSINNILKKHKLNGYKRNRKSWKFFRAKRPNELWQLDPKGPFKVEGKKYWILVCIDDYSRYILHLKLFEHKPSSIEIFNSIKTLIDKYNPKGILTDNNPFGDNWKAMLVEVNVIAHFAHPYYPQDKGKVERTIRNLVEEFINLLAKFPKWLNGKLEEWRCWFNEDRYHRGIKDYPANLYAQL